jgi:transcriptional regulator with XRE-family HTH domain
VLSADLLREARLRAGISQAELGRRVGRPASAISRWERGSVKPSLETLRELIRACGLEVTLGLATYDDSYVRDIEMSLALPPAERVRRAVAAANALERLRPAIERARAG